MQEEIYNEILMLMMKDNIDITSMIKEELWILLDKYDYSKKITDLVVTDNDRNSELVRNFLITKTVKGCTKRTLEYYEEVLKKAIPTFNKTIDTITTEDIRFYLATRQVVDKVSKTTANNERRVLSSFFTYLHIEEYIRRNPMAKIDKIKEDKIQKKAFTEYEIEKMRSFLKNELRIRAMFELLLSTGCRVTECCNIKIDDIHRNKIKVFGKGNKERTVYLNTRTQLAIEEYLRKRNDDNPYLFARSKKNVGEKGASCKRDWWMKKSEVHPNLNVESSYIEAIFRKVARKCNIDRANPHKFRRTCATMALRKGMPIEQVARMLGHENISTTQIYLDLTQEELEEMHKKYVNI